MNKFNLQELTEQAKNLTNKENIEEIKSNLYKNEASQEDIEKTITGISKEKNMEMNQVILYVSILLQQGATSPKTPGSKSLGGIRVDDIRRQVKKANDKITLRKLARSMKQEIIGIILTMGDDAIEGNLAKKMRLELGNISKEEAAWASDFQTYNEKCPTRVRNWLRKNYQDQFRN